MITVNENVSNIIDQLFRKEYGKIVSFLTSKFGFNFLDSAQDIAQDTLLTAFQNWTISGVPENPEGWIFIVAKNKAINLIKREKKYSSFKYNIKSNEENFCESDNISFKKEIEDGMLKMIFACCSDVLSIENQITLILSTLCGFNRKEISIALVMEEETIKKRLYRTKKKIRDENISLELPSLDTLHFRLNGVCNSLYLMFNEGYNSSSSNELIRKDICLEAFRLVQILSEYFDNDIKIKALFSLMCFHIARFDSRIDDNGAIILFKNQDRALWNKRIIEMGIVELSKASKGNSISSYHLEAGIALQHCIAKNYESTDWGKIKFLYEKLFQFKPSPIITLNLAIVEGIINGSEKAIDLLENLKQKNKRLSKYHLLYATLGEFYSRMNKIELAYQNFSIARTLTSNKKEIELLNRKLKSL